MIDPWEDCLTRYIFLLAIAEGDPVAPYALYDWLVENGGEAMEIAGYVDAMKTYKGNEWAGSRFKKWIKEEKERRNWIKEEKEKEGIL